MEHEMILLEADFRSVCARLTARRKVSVAQAAEHPIRNREVESSSDSAGSMIEEEDDG